MKKILVAIPYLNSGGVEVSLIRFINELSLKYDVDLLMLKKEGMYLKNLPKKVNIKEITYNNNIYSYERKFKDVLKIMGIKNKLKFIKYRLKLRNYLKQNKWSNYYKEILSHVNNIEETYDLAIDWHGYGHFITSIVASKVHAPKKAFWIHDEKNEWLYKIKPWLKDFNKIFCVGTACKKSLLKNYPNLKNKTDIFYNVIDYQNIRKKSLEKMSFNYDKNKLNIITVGRLEWQKAYDIAVLIARKLKDENIDFCWYVIGKGHKQKEIESLIKKHQLEDCFKLLGVKENPFPYVKNANIYVLPSRHEGYCISTLEAKILGKVIIATDIESNREQITNNVNGFLCDLDYKKFAHKIINVYNDKKLMKKIEENLKKENFNFEKEFEKLDNLMEE